jgi:hypothetical protein
MTIADVLIGLHRSNVPIWAGSSGFVDRRYVAFFSTLIRQTAHRFIVSVGDRQTDASGCPSTGDLGQVKLASGQRGGLDDGRRSVGSSIGRRTGR